MAVDYFLKIDGIAGESVDAKHTGEIDVLAFSWGVSQADSPVPGSGGGAGKAVFEDLLAVARTSKASPQLWLACATGQHLSSAVLTCRRTARGAKLEFLKITLSEVIVASYEVDGSDEELPLDQIALSFAKIETEYTPFDKTGKAQPPVRAGWDLIKNAKT